MIKYKNSIFVDIEQMSKFITNNPEINSKQQWKKYVYWINRLFKRVYLQKENYEINKENVKSLLNFVISVSKLYETDKLRNLNRYKIMILLNYITMKIGKNFNNIYDQITDDEYNYMKQYKYLFFEFANRLNEWENLYKDYD